MNSAIFKSDRGRQLVEARYRQFLDLWPGPNRRLLLPTSFGPTHVIACGEESRLPPLLLFHGSGSNSAMWISDIPRWAREHSIFAIDMLGEPGLSAAVRPALATDEHKNWLDEVLALIRVDRFAAVGISLGAWLILDYATRAPERVERLCLLAPAGVGRQRISFIFKILPLLMLGDWGLERALRLALGGEGNGDGHRAYMDFMLLIQKSYRPRRELMPIFSDQSLRRLRMPVLTVLGGQDAILDSAETRRRLNAILPRAQTLYLPDVGHGIFGERAVISGFLRGDSAV